MAKVGGIVAHSKADSALGFAAFTAADTPTVPDTSWHMTYTGECAESEGMTQAVILLNALGEQPDDYVLEVVPKAAAQATVYLQQGHDASRRLLQGKDSGGGAAPSDGGAAPSDGGCNILDTETRDVADWGTCVMPQDESVHIEGSDMVAGWHAFELCLRNTSDYVLRGVDKGGDTWDGGHAFVALNGNYVSNNISVDDSGAHTAALPIRTPVLLLEEEESQ
eukprot:gene24306-29526_t